MKQKRNIYLLFFYIFFFLNPLQTNAQESPDYRYPEASKRRLTGKDFEGKSMIKLKIMRNEIFARYGYKFKAEDMKKYFSRQKWYKAQHDDVNSKLTAIESENIKMIKQYEDNMRKKSSSLQIGDLIKKQKREIVFKALWGGGSDELGRIVGQEADSCGPNSFAVDDSGRIFILDQVNLRVQVYGNNGKLLKTIRIPNELFSDIDIGQSGNLFLLGSFNNNFVFVIDNNGKELKKIGLTGKGIPAAESVSEFYSRKDGLWVYDNGISVKICDESGAEGKDRQILGLGMPASDGNSVLKSTILGDVTVTIAQRKMDKISKQNQYHIYFNIPVSSIILLDTDKNGNIYLGAELLDQSNRTSPPYSIDDSHEVIVIMDSDGMEKQRIYMPPYDSPLSRTRIARVALNGIIYKLEFGENEAVMWRYMP